MSTINKPMWTVLPLALALSLLVAPGCYRIFGPYRSDAGSRADADDDRQDAPDAAPDDADAESPDALCTPTTEVCNGVDDDCDGEVDNGFTVADDPVSCGGLALEGVSQIAGVSWDRGAVVRAARQVLGTPMAPTCCVTDIFGTGSPELDLSLTVGVLLGLDGSDGRARYGNFPAIDATPGANVDRHAYELDWGEGMTLLNGPGDDLAIYEVDTSEPFSLQVRSPGGGWSPRLYRFYTAFDEIDGVSAALFDLSDFGLAEGARIDAIRVENIFNGNAAAGADLVDSAEGQGAVIRPGEAGYGSAHPLLVSAGGAEYADEELDTDLIWIVALRPIVPAICCIW